MAKNILVICEQRDGILQAVSLELVSKARELADITGQDVLALIMGHGVEPLTAPLVDHGADVAIFVDDSVLADYMTEPYTKAACAVIAAENPDIVLVGATSIGRDLAPRIAARAKTGLTADCTTLEICPETGDLLMTRPAFGGNLMATIVCPAHRPQMATVRAGVMVARGGRGQRSEVRGFGVDFVAGDANVEILSTTKIPKATEDMGQAAVLVAGGRGMARNFSLIGELAEALGGQVAASRAAVDAGLVHKDHQVGQTGKTVRPDVYIAAGISGAVQHTAGMQEAGLVIAINKDKDAPIFGVADVGIVGDAHKIIPKLVSALKL